MADTKSTSVAKRLIEEAGLKKSYAYAIAPERPASKPPRKPGLKTALQIYDKTKLKFGPLADASDAEIRTLAKVHERAA